MPSVYNSAPYLSTGTLQSDRQLKSLLPELLNIDDQSVADFMRFVVNFGSQIKYYNENNKHDGQWDGFFKNEYPFILAYIACIPLKEENLNLQSLGANLENKELIKTDRNISAQIAFADIIKIARRIDDWYTSLIDGEYNTKLLIEINGAIQHSLSDALIKLKYLGALIFGNQYELETGNTFKNFNLMWRLDESYNSDAHKSITDLFNDSNIETQNEDALLKKNNQLSTYYEELAGVLWVFIRVQSYIIITAKKELDILLAGDYQFKPYTALLLAYWDMYGYIQQNINTYSKKHLDFYYNKVLNMQKKAAYPDHIFVSFEPATGITGVQIPEGSTLDGGKDENGVAILFNTDAPLPVNNIAIVKLINLYFSTKNKLNPNKTLISDIFTSQILPGDILGLSRGWPPFGHDDTLEPAKEQIMQRTSVGFAVAAPILLLQEGNRIITLNLELTNDSKTSLNKIISNPNTASADLAQWFTNAFIVSGTGDKDWVLFTTRCLYSVSDNKITVTATLDNLAPAIVNYKKTLPGNVFDTQLPLLKLIINNNTPRFLYEILSRISVQAINIDVNVTGVKTLILKNTTGNVDPSKPFSPFGTNPISGSYLMFGSSEFAQKNISMITINAEWFGLPAKGFDAYYKNYDIQPPIDKNSFKFNIIKPGSYKLVKPAPPQAQNTDNSIFTLFSDVTDKGLVNYVATLPTGTNVQTIADGNEFYSIQYIGPEYTTLSEAYSQGSNKTMWANAQKLIAYAKEPPPPKNQITTPIEIIPTLSEPKTLLLKTLTVDYKATTRIITAAKNKQQMDFFHIDVFNQYKIFQAASITNNIIAPAKTINSLPLVPVYDKCSYFYIGLEGVELPSIVHILFQLKLKPVINANPDQPNITWEYLYKDGWKAFDIQHRQIDNTNKLSKSEIIVFSLPDDMVCDNAMMPLGTYWIRGSLTEDTAWICNLENIYTHAVSATRIIDVTNVGQTIKPILPSTIKGLLKPLPQIKKVSQPAISFGGKDAEDEYSYYLRVSERLNHKQRAVSSWDYERLLLQQYPNLFYVKCLNTVDIKSNKFSAGYVTVVVIPNLLDKSHPYNLRAPRLPLEALQDMNDFLVVAASPMVKIEVTNPEYIFLTVTCAVTFNPDVDPNIFLKRLNEDICNYLSPWALGIHTYDVKAKLTGFNIISFIEKCSYIVSVNQTSFKMEFSAELDNGRYKLTVPSYDKNNLYQAISQAKNPWVIIASMENHNLTIDNENI